MKNSGEYATIYLGLNIINGMVKWILTNGGNEEYRWKHHIF